MPRKRADKVLISTMPTPPTSTNGRGDKEASPYRTSGDAGPRIAPKRTPRFSPKENILQVAAAAGRFETLGKAIQAAGLAGTLSEAGPFTLFAPTDKAFAKMTDEDLTALLEDKAMLRGLISYHIVPSKVRAPRRRVPSAVATLDAKELEISVVPEDGGYRIGEARIVKTNIRASNGVIHALDTVLTPR